MDGWLAECMHACMSKYIKSVNVLTECCVQVSNFEVPKSSEQDALMDKLVLLHERDLMQPPRQVSPCNTMLALKIIIRDVH